MASRNTGTRRASEAVLHALEGEVSCGRSQATWRRRRERGGRWRETKVAVATGRGCSWCVCVVAMLWCDVWWAGGGQCSSGNRSGSVVARGQATHLHAVYLLPCFYSRHRKFPKRLCRKKNYNWGLVLWKADSDFSLYNCDLYLFLKWEPYSYLSEKHTVKGLHKLSKKSLAKMVYLHSHTAMRTLSSALKT